MNDKATSNNSSNKDAMYCEIYGQIVIWHCGVKVVLSSRTQKNLLVRKGRGSEGERRGGVWQIKSNRTAIVLSDLSKPTSVQNVTHQSDYLYFFRCIVSVGVFFVVARAVYTGMGNLPSMGHSLGGSYRNLWLGECLPKRATQWTAWWDMDMITCC